MDLLAEQIKCSIEKGMYGCGIFIDLKKAFDTVNHSVLLRKLEHYGIRENSLHWFTSYLSNRKQYVYHNGYSSEVKLIKCKVFLDLFFSYYTSVISHMYQIKCVSSSLLMILICIMNPMI